MNIVCTKNNLLKGLLLIERAQSKNPSLPILTHARFEAKAGKINLTATDLEMAINTDIAAKTDSEGIFVLALKPLLGFVSSLPDEAIQIKTVAKHVIIKSGKLQGKFITGNAEEFPIVPKIKANERLKIKSLEFTKALEDVIIAASLTDIRPELTGVYINVSSESINIVATDTFRLALRTISYKSPENFSIIVPQKSAQEIIRLFKDEDSLEIRVSDNQCEVESNNLLFTTKLLQGNFPDFWAIIPKTPKTIIEISHKELLRNLDAAGFFVGRLNDIKLSVKNNGGVLSVSTENSSVGEYLSELDTAYGNGEDQNISLNLRYFIDGVKKIYTENIVIELNGDIKPLVLKPKKKDVSDLYLLMPIRSS